MKRRRLWMGIGGLVVALWLVGHWRSQRMEIRSGEQKDSILVNRLWVDHIPEKDTEAFDIFAVLTRHPVGVFQHGSLWEGNWAMFEWQMKGENKDLHIRFPQSGQTATIEWLIQDSRKVPFDYCLTLKGNPRGPEKWFSRKDWVIGSLSDVQALKDQFQPEKE